MENTKAPQAANLHDAICEASNCINSFYPLTNFIANNALKSLETMPFEKAMRLSTRIFGANGFLPLAQYRELYESGRIAPADFEEALRNSHKNITSEEERQCSIKSVAELLDQKTNSQIVTTINRQIIKWCGVYIDRTQAQWSPGTKTDLYGFWKEYARHD